MPESALVNKAENYLKEIASDSINLEDIDEFDNFKNLYFKLDDRLNYLQKLREDMDVQGYTTPFTSLNKYGTKTVAEVAADEIRENSRHNQIFRMKANAKKNILDRVKSAIDAHKIALGNLEQYGYVKCNSCYKKYSMEEYKNNNGECSCKSTAFTFKTNKELAHRLEIIPYLPLSGNYMVLMSELSQYARESFKQVLNILKQERKGHVKTISLRIRFKDDNNRLIRKTVTLDSEYVDNYEEEVRNRYGRNVRIEALRFHRTKPAIIDDKHARTALALAYVGYAQEIIDNIRDDILKRRLTDFKRIRKYDEILEEYENQVPDFIDRYDLDAIEAWRKSEINNRFRNLNYYQVYLFLQMIKRYGGYYFSKPSVVFYGDGENAFGVSESSKATPELANRESAKTNLAFHKMLIKVIRMFDEDEGTRIIGSFAKQYSLHSYTGLSNARREGKQYFREYWRMMNELDIRLHPVTRIYYVTLLVLGEKMDRMMEPIRRKVKRSS